MRMVKFLEVKNKILKIIGEIEVYIVNFFYYRVKVVLGEIFVFLKFYVDSLFVDELFFRFNFLWEEKYKFVVFQFVLVMIFLIVVELFDWFEGVCLGDFMFFVDIFGDFVVIVDGFLLDDIIVDYLDVINLYFVLIIKSGLKKFLFLFKGELDLKSFDLDDICKWNFFKDGSGFRFFFVVMEKMDLKFWCFYRYILLEIYVFNLKLMYFNLGVDNFEFSVLGGVVFE